MQTKLIATALAGVVAAGALPVFALTVGASGSVQAGGVSASTSATVQVRLQNAKAKADQEIQRRIQRLNDLTAKVQAMAKVSSESKAAVAATVQAQIGELTSLQAKIDADTDVTSLKADIQSIAKSYRIFMLVIPQGTIEVAADRMQTAIGLLTSFSAKLQTRIATGQAAGKDVTVVTASLNDMNAKLADANVQAAAAVSHVQGLQPDNGDKTVLAANEAALKQARADLRVGQSDLEAARKDARSIVQAILSWQIDTAASSTVTTQ